MPTSLTDGHLSDGEIVRLLDGEDGEAVRGHVEACAECGARLRQLRRRSAGLARLLRESDWEAPAAEAHDELALRRMRPRRAAPPAPRVWLRAAAVMLVLLGAGVAASPLRARIAEWISAGWTQLAGGGASVAPVDEPGVPPAAGTRVSLSPGEVLTVEITTAQAAGVVEVRPGGSAVATAEQVGGGEPAHFLLLPSQSTIRVQNRAASTAGYRVSVPAGVRTVRVHVGSAPPRVLTRAQVADGVRVSLVGGAH